MARYIFGGPLNSGTSHEDWEDVLNTSINLPDDGSSRMSWEFSIDVDTDDNQDIYWEQALWINETDHPFRSIQDRMRADTNMGEYITPIPQFFDMVKLTGTITIRAEVKRHVSGTMHISYWRLLVNTY